MYVCASEAVSQTDGIRYLLYVSPKPAVYLVDRKFDFYSLANSFGSLCEVLAEEGTTLLDGEMIRHLETKKFYFMVRRETYTQTHIHTYADTYIHTRHTTRIHDTQHTANSQPHKLHTQTDAHAYTHPQFNNICTQHRRNSLSPPAADF